MTTWAVQQFGVPSGSRAARALDSAGKRSADRLAGRTVWCVTSAPEARAAADALNRHLHSIGQPAVAADRLEVSTPESFRPIAQGIDDMLAGVPEAVGGLGAPEQQLCAESVAGSEALMGAGVCPDDVVVLHDSLTAMLAEAVRGRGAHAVWHVQIGGGGHADVAISQALDFLRRYTSGTDAYVITARRRVGPETEVEEIVALMPSAGLVDTKEVVAAGPSGRDDSYQGLGWISMLADVVSGDRNERVGGRLHPRPDVPMR